MFVVMAEEPGLRSHVLMELRYRHVIDDVESGTISVAVRLEPPFHVGKKAAGYTLLGIGSVRLLREGLDEGLVEARPDSKLIPSHGFRKYFENALDEANIDHERQMVIEGHFAGTRVKHYQPGSRRIARVVSNGIFFHHLGV